ncbi:MAG: PEGA domain-containing protein [Spirochaetota bacterium]
MRERRLRCLAILTFAVGIATATIAEEAIVVKTHDLADDVSSTLLVRAFVGDTEIKGATSSAFVTLDRRVVGKPPYFQSSLQPGRYHVGVGAEGFTTRETVLKVEAHKAYEITVPLWPATGFVNITVFPPDAEVVVGGKSYKPGLIELAAGTRDLEVRSFGYIENHLTVAVLEGSILSVTTSLSKAAFAITSFTVNRPLFNPSNPGPFGELWLAFSVSAPGSGHLEVLDEDGSIVAKVGLEPFTTWNHSLVWKGRAADGSVLGDGNYEVRLVTMAAAPAQATMESNAASAISASLEVRIDSGLVALPLGQGEGLPGLALLPLALGSPAGLGLAEAGVSLSGAAPRVLGTMALSLGGGPWSAGFALGGSADGSGDFRIDLGLGYLAGSLEDLRFGLALSGHANGTTVGTVQGIAYSGRVLLPLSWIPSNAENALAQRLVAGMAPAVMVTGSTRAAGASSAGRPGLGIELRAGAGIVSGWSVLGLSARSGVTGLEVLAPLWDGLDARVEGRLALPSTPLVLSAGLGMAFRRASTLPSFSPCIAMGVWF